jgi:DNA-directed RNA polymerase subunit L
METKVLTDEKENLVIEMDNQTIAELLRVYLNKDENIVIAAWKRTHPNKPVIFEIKTKGKVAKKVLEEAVGAIEKDTSKVLDDFKKAVK